MDEAELFHALVDLKLLAEQTGQHFLAHLIGMAALEARRGRDQLQSYGKNTKRVVRSDH